MVNLIGLQETSQGIWKANYHGRFGIYSTQATIDRGNIVDFTCTCPSKVRPCKHLPIVKEAIQEQIANQENVRKEAEKTVQDLLKRRFSTDFVNFMTEYTRSNIQFAEAVVSRFGEDR
jgi:uncharacterized Zn finger protein